MAIELCSLRAELRSAGVFEHREARSWGKLGLMAAALAACLVGIATWGFVAAIALVPVAGMLCTSIAMYGHEGSHRSFSGSSRRNAVLVYLVFPVLSGLGSLYWHNKHDRLHHGHPNVEGMDPDIKPFPFVSSLGDHQRCNRGERWFQRNFQRYAFWPMSLLMTMGMRRSSMVYLCTHARTQGIDRAWLVDAAGLVVHYTCWIVIPTIVWGPLAALLTYAAIWSVVGICLALVFAPAHIGLPVVNDQHRDWLHQIETTRNLELPRVVSMFFIGLDYQIEHHLFPKIPHMNLPKAAAITRAWCARTRMPSLSEPYLHALGDAARFIRDAWNREAISPADMRAALRATVLG
jgi:fatty acid desaturase